MKGKKQRKLQEKNAHEKIENERRFYFHSYIHEKSQRIAELKTELPTQKIYVHYPDAKEAVLTDVVIDDYNTDSNKFKEAIIDASTNYKGKSDLQRLTNILRDENFNLTIDDRKLLADFIEGKFKEKLTPPRKYLTDAQIVALSVKNEMYKRRYKGLRIRNTLPKIIDEISAEYGVDPQTVAEIIRSGRFR